MGTCTVLKGLPEGGVVMVRAMALRMAPVSCGGGGEDGARSLPCPLHLHPCLLHEAEQQGVSPTCNRSD